MKINNISNTASFGRVYAVAGKPEKTEKLVNFLDKQEKKSGGIVTIEDITDVYKKNSANSKGLCSKYAQRGNEILLIVTGKEDHKKMSFMEPGWTTISAITQHIDKFITLNNIHNDAKDIIRTMKK